jgi:hypothetical protein
LAVRDPADRQQVEVDVTRPQATQRRQQLPSLLTLAQVDGKLARHRRARQQRLAQTRVLGLVQQGHEGGHAERLLRAGEASRDGALELVSNPERLPPDHPRTPAKLVVPCLRLEQRQAGDLVGLQHVEARIALRPPPASREQPECLRPQAIDHRRRLVPGRVGKRREHVGRPAE